MLSEKSQSDQSWTSLAEKLFDHKLRATLSLLLPSSQSASTEKHTISQNLMRKLCEFEPINKTFWGKRDIVVRQNLSRPYDYLNERGNMLARNCRHLILTTEKFNTKHYYDNAIPVSNISTHPNLMIDN